MLNPRSLCLCLSVSIAIVVAAGLFAVEASSASAAQSSAMPLDFGHVPVGATSEVESTTITNSGAAAETIASVTSTNSAFVLSNNSACTAYVNNGTEIIPATVIPSGGRCALRFAASPAANGTTSGQIAVSFTNASPVVNVAASVYGYTPFFQVTAGVRSLYKGIDIINDAMHLSTAGGGFPANTSELPQLCDIHTLQCIGGLATNPAQRTDASGYLSGVGNGSDFVISHVPPGMYVVIMTVGSLTVLGPEIDLVPSIYDAQFFAATPEGTGHVLLVGNGWMSTGQGVSDVAVAEPSVTVDIWGGANCSAAAPWTNCTRLGSVTLSTYNFVTGFGAFAQIVDVPTGTLVLEAHDSTYWNESRVQLDGTTWTRYVG